MTQAGFEVSVVPWDYDFLQERFDGPFLCFDSYILFSFSCV